MSIVFKTFFSGFYLRERERNKQGRGRKTSRLPAEGGGGADMGFNPKTLRPWSEPPRWPKTLLKVYFFFRWKCPISVKHYINDGVLSNSQST